MGITYKRGNTYWIKYYRNGKPFYESAKSQKETEAKRLLKLREGEIVRGKAPGIYFDRIRYDELAEDLLNNYRINGRKSADRAGQSVAHLTKHFKGYRATEITTSAIEDYIVDRRNQGAANGTINRELAALKRMLKLGERHEPPKVSRVPHIPMLEENNVRQGFFEHGDFLKLRDALPDHMKGFVTLGYNTGMRVSEVAKLKWKQVDLDRGLIRLEVGETKNKEGRTIYLLQEEIELLKNQWGGQKKGFALSPYVFTNESGKDRIKNFRRAWNRACRDTDLGYGYKINKKYVEKYAEKLPAGPIFHDFRRTAVRNMDRAGIPRPVGMKRSGHKTESVYNRYNIVDDKDLQLAARKLQSYLDAQNGYKMVTISHFDTKKEAAS